MYKISANLVYRELRNATFEGEKMPTSIRMPDSAYYLPFPLMEGRRVALESESEKRLSVCNRVHAHAHVIFCGVGLGPSNLV